MPLDFLPFEITRQGTITLFNLMQVFKIILQKYAYYQTFLVTQKLRKCQIQSVFNNTSQKISRISFKGQIFQYLKRVYCRNIHFMDYGISERKIAFNDIYCTKLPFNVMKNTFAA
jgi:hypothetical protein